MKWIKGLRVGLMILNMLAEKSVDEKIGIADLLDVAVDAADMLGYDVEEVGINLEDLE